MENNNVRISGIIDEPLTMSYENNNMKFYEGKIRVKRTSGVFDTIPITIPEKLAPNGVAQCYVTIIGEFRSFNKIVDGKSKLMLTVFAKEIIENHAEIFENSAILHGYICKEPIYRETPFNKQITDILLAVNRNYNKSDYLPVIAWGKNARLTKDLSIGTEVHIKARLQSREYTKNGEIKTAYEVSTMSIEVSPCEFEPLEEVEL